MIKIDLKKCKGCKICANNCPISAIDMLDKKALIKDNCVSCGICLRVCPFAAIEKRQKKIIIL